MVELALQLLKSNWVLGAFMLLIVVPLYHRMGLLTFLFPKKENETPQNSLDIKTVLQALTGQLQTMTSNHLDHLQQSADRVESAAARIEASQQDLKKGQEETNRALDKIIYVLERVEKNTGDRP